MVSLMKYIFWVIFLISQTGNVFIWDFDGVQNHRKAFPRLMKS